MLQFEKLKASDQDEIIDFIKLKISRWLKTIMSDREFWVTNSVRLQNRIVYTLVSLERTGSLSEIEHSRAV
ncbi:MULTISPECIES: hypothetical protein [unclassified Paenibacillus]|uniref:hypothetical protein n=1 Tax=unclassified Paenibacillus TaxID=185978 RepID=UPI0027D7E035|nr:MULTISPECIES: hypothetical protein [unclassified Paenibacillus]